MVRFVSVIAGPPTAQRFDQEQWRIERVILYRIVPNRADNFHETVFRGEGSSIDNSSQELSSRITRKSPLFLIKLSPPFFFFFVDLSLFINKG